MIWISIILGIIEAIPTLISLFKQLIDAIHGHPLQFQHEAALHVVLSSWMTHKDPAVLTQDLQDLHAQVKA